MPRLTEPTAYRVGTGVVDKIYKGSTKIWPPAAPVFQSRTTGASATGFNTTVTLPGSIAAGDLLLFAAFCSRSTSDVTPTMNNGWTELAKLYLEATVASGILNIWAKIATASESNPTHSFIVGNNSRKWVCERWTGVKELPAGITPVGNLTNGAQTMNSNAVVAVPGSQIVTFLGARAATAGLDPTWGGGAAAADTGDSGVVGNLYSGTQQADSGSKTHTAAFTNTMGSAVQIMGSIVLKPPA